MGTSFARVIACVYTCLANRYTSKSISIFFQTEFLQERKNGTHVFFVFPYPFPTLPSSHLLLTILCTRRLFPFHLALPPKSPATPASTLLLHLPLPPLYFLLLFANGCSLCRAEQIPTTALRFLRTEPSLLSACCSFRSHLLRCFFLLAPRWLGACLVRRNFQLTAASAWRRACQLLDLGSRHRLL